MITSDPTLRDLMDRVAVLERENRDLRSQVRRLAETLNAPVDADAHTPGNPSPTSPTSLLSSPRGAPGHLSRRWLLRRGTQAAATSGGGL